jgi:hypothetical protein
MRSAWLASAAMFAVGCGGGTGGKHAVKRPVAVAERSPPPARKMTAHVTPDGVTTLTPGVVLEKIRSTYMGGMKRCYSVLLKNRATVRGKVTILFTVNAVGKVQERDARGFEDRVDACLEAQIADWRFPVPRDSAGTPTQATFALPLELQPD